VKQWGRGFIICIVLCNAPTYCKSFFGGTWRVSLENHSDYEKKCGEYSFAIIDHRMNQSSRIEGKII
jgi:hypothetical protein